MLLCLIPCNSQCTQGCANCGNWGVCLHCSDGYFIYGGNYWCSQYSWECIFGYQCYSSCPAGYSLGYGVGDAETDSGQPLGDSSGGPACFPCNGECSTCEDYSPNTCTSCPSGQFLYNGGCVNTCPSGTLISGSDCVTACPEGFVAAPNGTICISCPANCETCVNGYICTACDSGYYLVAHGYVGFIDAYTCATSCPSGYTLGHYTNPTTGAKVYGSDGNPGCIKNGANNEPPNVAVPTAPADIVLLSENRQNDMKSAISKKINQKSAFSRNHKKAVLSN